MSSLIIYRPNDMAFVLKSGINFIDPLSTLFFNRLGLTLGYIFTNNIFFIVSIIFSLYFCYLFFTKINNNKIISILYSVLFSFSGYFLYRSISLTPALYFVWVFPLLTYLLLSKKDLLVIILSIVFIYTSTYYWFFSIILICFWYLFNFILNHFIFRKFILKVFVLLVFNLIFIIIFSRDLILSNIALNKDYKDTGAGLYASDRVYRPIEDWYNLSFRPWYFFIPPKSSVFFGEFSKNIHEKIKNTGYYLADDYMEEEMAGSYMGWHFLIGLGTVAVILFLKKYKNIEFKTFKTVYENKEMIIRSFFIIFCILLISGPPSFTIGGVTIYTPTYLLYYIVPVFRTLVRWAVVIYLFVLIINSFLVQDLYNLMKTKLQKVLFILTFLTLNFVIFAIKIPVINVNKPPQEIAFVKEKYPESVPYAVYPKGDYYSIFWIISHEDLLINPVNFINYETGFDSNEFSKKIITEEGIQEFLNHNPKYLIYYPNNISDDDLGKITKINPTLKSKEDIYEFFKSKFGDGVVVGESVVFEINK